MGYSKLWRIVAPTFISMAAWSSQAATVIGVAPMGTDVTKEADVKAFESYLNVNAGYATVFIAQDSWSSFASDAGYLSNSWHNSNPNRRLMVSVPLTMPGTSLASVASGNYDSYFKNAAQVIAQYHANAMIRIGWEFNGTWYAWSIANGQASNYAAAFRRVQGIFKAASSQFKFVWCTNINTTSAAPDAAYPGDAYVDIVATDVYDNHYGSDTPQSRITLYESGSYGLNWLVSFANSHGKQLAIPEWGAGQSGDNGYFITQILNYTRDHNFAYQSYWNSDSAYKARLTDGHYPQETAAYRSFVASLGSNPSPTPTPTPAPTPTPTPTQPPPSGSNITVQAEDYMAGGEGVGYHTGHGDWSTVHPRSDSMDITTVSGYSGNYIGWLAAGQWYAYSVNVPTAGYYTFGLRSYSQWAGLQVHFTLDGVNLPATVAPDGSSSPGYAYENSQHLLSAGTHKIVMYVDAATGQNIDSFILALQAATQPQNPPSSVTVQVEDYMTGGEGVGYHTGHGDWSTVHPRSDSMDITTVSGYSGNYIGWLAAGQWFAYSVNIPATASYTFGLRSYSQWAGLQVHFTVDGVSLPATIAPDAASSPGYAYEASSHQLSAGTHKIVLYIDAASGQNIDSFVLAPQAGAPAPQPTTATVQVENYIAGGEGVGYHTGHGDYGNAQPRSDSMDLTTVSGQSGYFLGWLAAGQYFVYNVNLTAAANYKFGLRAQASWAGLQVHFSVDGVNLPATIAPAGSSSIGYTYESSSHQLSAGSHKVVLYVDAASGQNIDAFTLTPQ